MHRMEDSILSRLGVGPVFRPPATSPIVRPRSHPHTRARTGLSGRRGRR
jgi:hypothetical protein